MLRPRVLRGVCTQPPCGKARLSFIRPTRRGIAASLALCARVARENYLRAKVGCGRGPYACPTLNSPHHPSSEWLLTNGLGGFAMGCADGVPRRRYHAWLIAATAPPVGRMVALHSCAEWLVVQRDGREDRIDLSAFRFEGGGDPHGRFAACERGDFGCAWTCSFPELGITLRRVISLARGANASTIRYEIHSPGHPARLELRPFTPMRDFHHLAHEGEPPTCTPRPDGSLSIEHAGQFLTLAASAAKPLPFHADPQWWRRFEYTFDRDRGQEHHEDLPSPGVFISEFAPGDVVITLRAWVAPTKNSQPPIDAGQVSTSSDLAAQESFVVKSAGGVKSPALSAAVAAADQFVVRRAVPTEAGPQQATSIIAGYPWFSDWGRDTCISLRGLLLTTGRHERARETLEAFAAMRESGLIPNCFDNGSGQPEYNTVDASLWYLIAACAYVRAVGEPLDGEILAACLEIIKAYRDGTGFGIRMDPADGLIAAGDESTQLTWMDARRDGVVFTPRHGKAVEINALWYAGLLEVASCLPEWYIQSARELPELAEWCGRSFVKAFWNARDHRLHDCLTPRRAAGIIVGWDPVDEIRSNQVFAVSLPHSPLDIAKQRDVLACVRQHLLTPVGLRTLAPGSRGYQPRYEGDLFARDRAYHNGTVWPWLIGPYAEGVLRVGKFSPEARAEALAALAPLLQELTRRGDSPGPILQLAEIYDADEPRRPQGCPAQAWSVAEVLRVYAMAMSVESPESSSKPANA